jgi:hypothetical protein
MSRITGRDSGQHASAALKRQAEKREIVTIHYT